MTKTRGRSHKTVTQKEESEPEAPFGTPEEESPQTQASSEQSIAEEVVKVDKKEGKKHKKKKKQHASQSEDSRSESSLIIDTWSRKYAICAEYPPKQPIPPKKDKKKSKHKKHKKKHRRESPPKFLITRVETAASKRIKVLVRDEELKIKARRKKEAKAERHRLRELEKQASLTDEKKAKLAHL